MDYCAKESTINAYPVEEVKKDQTIQSSIKETCKILREMKAALDNFGAIVNGSKLEEKVPVDANCLWDEARIMTAMAYDNLQRLIEIRGSIF